MSAPFLDANQLASLRATWAATFLDTSCVISRPTKAPTTDGYQEETPAPIATVSAKMSAPNPAQLQMFAGRIGTLQSFVVRFAASTDVQIGDVLTLAGQTLKVQGPLQPQSWSALTSVLATEIREGV